MFEAKELGGLEADHGRVKQAARLLSSHVSQRHSFG
jgi:hypothetical protein